MSLDLSATVTDVMKYVMKSLGDETYITIKRKSGGVFDPITGTTTGAISETLPAVGIVSKVDTKLADGTRIKSTDKLLLLDNSITPTYKDVMSFGGVDYSVTDIDSVNPSGIVQLWKVTVRV